MISRKKMRKQGEGDDRTPESSEGGPQEEGKWPSMLAADVSAKGG